MRPRRTSESGWSVRNRLVLLVLFPLTVVVVSVGLVAADRQNKSQAAADVQAQVDGLRSLVGLQTAPYGERRISVDDFGTGFTSISQLRRLPIDELKIDRSLVGRLPSDQALVRVVQDLADHFEMTTVAEGVECEAQATLLKEIGCTQLQGWLYAEAMPASDLGPWIDAASRVATIDSP